MPERGAGTEHLANPFERRVRGVGSVCFSQRLDPLRASEQRIALNAAVYKGPSKVRELAPAALEFTAWQEASEGVIRGRSSIDGP